MRAMLLLTLHSDYEPIFSLAFDSVRIILVIIASRSGLYRGKSSVIAKDRVLFCTTAEEKAQLVSKMGGFVLIVDVDWNSLISASKVASSVRPPNIAYHHKSAPRQLCAQRLSQHAQRLPRLIPPFHTWHQMAAAAAAGGAGVRVLLAFGGDLGRRSRLPQVRRRNSCEAGPQPSSRIPRPSPDGADA